MQIQKVTETKMINIIPRYLHIAVIFITGKYKLFEHQTVFGTTQVIFL